MPLQHYENLFRRYKGQVVIVKTMSGGLYEGRVTEITNDLVELVEIKEDETARVFLLYQAIESVLVRNSPANNWSAPPREDVVNRQE